MSSNNAIEDWAAAWTGVQRQSWDAWGELLGTSRVDIPWEELRKRSLMLIQELTDHCLKTQADCAKAVMNGVSANGEKNFLDQFTESMREVLASCAKLQQGSCESWFKAMRETAPFPSSPYERLQKNGDGLAQAWQKAAERMLAAQAAFMSALLPDYESKSEPAQRVPSRKEKVNARAAA